MIDLSKLKSVRQMNGKTVAQCPACAAVGADNKGDHFFLGNDGAFGCVANQGDKEHNREILKLIGTKSTPPRPIVPIKRLQIPESKILMSLGRGGRHKSTSVPGISNNPVERKESKPADSNEEPPTSQSGRDRDWGGSRATGATIEEVEEFLRKGRK